MRRLWFLALVLPLIVVPSVLASGGSQHRAWPSELFAVRPAGGYGPLEAFDMRDGGKRFALPAGMASADGRRFFAASGAALRAFDPSTGRLVRTYRLGERFAVAAVSQNGRYVVLERGTQLGVLDTVAGRTARRLRLPASFDVDAISPEGDKLFLIQHYASGRYDVRLYDLAAGRLQAGALREKGETEQMAGVPWSRVPTPDGSWLLTLYLNTREHEAFVHTLNLRQGYPVCIDLPSARSLEQLKTYSLTLAPDGYTVYAANPALGVVAQIDLNELRVVGSWNFPAKQGGRTAAGALSPDGTLTFASGRDLWAFDPVTTVVRGPYRAGADVAGLAYSSDGKRVYAARTDGRVDVFDAVRGKALSF